MEKNEQPVSKIIEGPICRDATLRNASDLLEEARKGNIESCLISYRRKSDGTIRTFIRSGDELDRFLKCIEVAKYELMEIITAATEPAHPELEDIEDDDGE